MLMFPVSLNESSRLKNLKKYGILDTKPESAFDHLTTIAGVAMIYLGVKLKRNNIRIEGALECAVPGRMKRLRPEEWIGQSLIVTVCL